MTSYLEERGRLQRRSVCVNVVTRTITELQLKQVMIERTRYMVIYAKRMGFDCFFRTRALISVVEVPWLMEPVLVDGCELEHRKDMK